MIEMVMVVIVIGVISAIAVPRFSNSLSTQRADAAARVLAADLQRVGDLARSQSAPVTIVFNQPAGTYRVAGVMLTDRGGGSSQRSIPDEFPGVSIAACDFNGSTSLTIDGYGSPSAGGVIILNGGGGLRTLVLSKATGHVQVYQGVPTVDSGSGNTGDTGNTGSSDGTSTNTGGLDQETTTLLGAVTGLLNRTLGGLLGGGH